MKINHHLHELVFFGIFHSKTYYELFWELEADNIYDAKNTFNKSDAETTINV